MQRERVIGVCSYVAITHKKTEHSLNYAHYNMCQGEDTDYITCCLEMADLLVLLDVLLLPQTKYTATTIGATVNPGYDALLLRLLVTRDWYGTVL